VRQVAKICDDVLGMAMTEPVEEVIVSFRQHLYTLGQPGKPSPMHDQVGDHPHQMFPTTTRPACRM